MNLIIPMAGRGSRLRPHTLTVPKPLVPVAGKPIVQRLVESLTAAFPGEVDEIAFVTGDFGEGVTSQLTEIAASVGARGRVYSQDTPLGTAHAILCAEESLSGPCLVAFADTLFKADFKFDPHAQEGIIWVQRVDDPSSFGVVQLNEEGIISDFVEKPTEWVSDLAIVGIYYFRDGAYLKRELQYLLDNNITDKGEFQLTNALENMKAKGTGFHPGYIEEWLDCGNKEAVVHANQRVLEIRPDEARIAPSAQLTNAVVIPPCFIGDHVHLENAVVGPHVSIGNRSRIENSVIKNSVIQSDTRIRNANLQNSMIGNLADYEGQPSDVSLGDYSVHKG